MRNPLVRSDAMRGMSAEHCFCPEDGRLHDVAAFSPTIECSEVPAGGRKASPQGRGRRLACHSHGTACANRTGAPREMPCLPLDRLAAAEKGPRLAIVVRGWCLHEAGKRNVA